MGAIKLVSATFDYAVYVEMRQIAKDNDIPLAALVRRCCEIGLKKIVGKSTELKE